MSDRELMLAAVKARKNAYAPYSGFSVGAALLCEDGSLYTGCNIENAAFSPTNCAERTAFFKAVSDGKRSFSTIAVIGGAGDGLNALCAPCGVCRQVMAEFCRADFRVLLGTPDDIREMCLADLLPAAFTATDIGGA